MFPIKPFTARLKPFSDKKSSTSRRSAADEPPTGYCAVPLLIKISLSLPYISLVSFQGFIP